jgi:hypothetical protein
VRLKFKSGESGILPATKIKFTRREGEISFAANDKIYPQSSAQARREMKFKNRASYTRMPMYTARVFNKRQMAV